NVCHPAALYDAAVKPDGLNREGWLLLPEVRLRGAFEVDDGVIVAPRGEAELVVQTPRGIRLTPAGRDANAVWARVEPGGDLEATVERAYRRFLTINTELLRLCSDWQTRPARHANHT